MDKVFQIGFNKCGTLSLYELFHKNHLASVHYDFGGIAMEVKNNIRRKRSNVLGKYEDFTFLCDMEFICDWEHPFKGANTVYKDHFQELDQCYPDAKFILNTRSLKKWLKSRINHGGGWYLTRYMNIYNLSEESVIDMWIKDWYDHHAAVVNYFYGRNEKLLILDLDHGLDQCGHDLDQFFSGKLNLEHWGHTHQTKPESSKIQLKAV